MQRTLDALDQAKRSGADRTALYQAACRDIVENVGSNRVSIWHFDAERTSIISDCYYIAEEDRFSSGQVLTSADAPSYFAAILTEQYIVAPRAREQRLTKELSRSYFEPNQIYSLLDYIIHANFTPIGVICCEHAYAVRDWSEADKNYLLSISTLVSFELT